MKSALKFLWVSLNLELVCVQDLSFLIKVQRLNSKNTILRLVHQFGALGVPIEYIFGVMLSEVPRQPN